MSVRIVQDRDTGKPRGFAFVNFESPDCVDTAIRECQGMELCGRNVRLDRSAAGFVGRGFGKGKGFINVGMVPGYSPSDYAMYGGGYRHHSGSAAPAPYPMMAHAPHAFNPMSGGYHPGYPYPVAGFHPPHGPPGWANGASQAASHPPHSQAPQQPQFQQQQYQAAQSGASQSNGGAPLPPPVPGMPHTLYPAAMMGYHQMQMPPSGASYESKNLPPPAPPSSTIPAVSSTGSSGQ